MHFKRPPRHFSGVSARRAGSLFGSVEIVLQPIVDVTTGSLVAAEALARFPNNPDTSVDETFALAYANGRGADLEAACLRSALRTKRAELPADVALTVNVSPNALDHAAVQSALAVDLTGVIIEITEHVASDLDVLRARLEELRSRGAQIAVDDASTGYAGLLRLTALRPDFVKLDRGLVRGARGSLEQSAVIEALVRLSHRMGARVLGEGVETLDDLTALAELDVDLAQGFYICEPTADLPVELPDAMESCRIARGELMRNENSAVPVADPIGIRRVTAALAASVQLADLQAALGSAAVNLGIDVISLSTLTGGRGLREVSCSGARVDPKLYRLADYPETKHALETGEMLEVHLADPFSDRAERAVMQADGTASMLLTPVIGRGQRLGVLEFRHGAHRRWSSHDLTQARILSEHIASVLLRMSLRTGPAVAVAG
ncbi:EAL domain-containing protein [Jatrophihabitans telluris]|uniref:EAL domain-containing protein n=1 Tax=Jatrophihabitans telluris TaxID=2038343 RepID=A0ABY4R0U0_9ACTN|nr:EAL domain-containing protein [Jatrophihabitans telluris]UQX89464.1 EAL domain-containing protein [Jatrophihabitans telluris]